MPNDDREDMTDVRVPIEIEDPEEAEEPATMKPEGPRSRGTGVTAAPWTSDPPRASEVDEDPSVSIEPPTVNKPSRPPPPNDSPAAEEPASITLEPQMNVRGIDRAVLDKMKKSLADSGSGEVPAASGPDGVKSTDPAPVLTFPKKARSLTLVGVGERPPPLPSEADADDPSTIGFERAKVVPVERDSVVEETERRKPLTLESPITLTEEIPVPSRPQRDTEMTSKDDIPTKDEIEITTKDKIDAPPRTAKMTGALAKTLQSPPALAFATTEKASTTPSKPPVAPTKPQGTPSKPPPAVPRPATKPVVAVQAPQKAEVPASPASARVRKETAPMPPPTPPPTAPRPQSDSEDSSPRSYRAAFSMPPAEAKVSPQVKRTAYTLAASFVLAGALASGFVVWQASSRTKHAVAAVRSASAAPPDEPPPAVTAPPEPEPSASVTAPPPVKPAPSAVQTTAKPKPAPPAPTAKPKPPAPATAKPKPPPPATTSKPKPVGTSFDPNAI